MISLTQHIENIKQLANELNQIDSLVKLASGSSLTVFSERVFVNGQSATGQKFTYNDTTQLYVDPSTTFGNTAALKPPKGKTGKTEFKSGKKHKTTWVESYKALRGLVGRENSFVNWTATNDLKSDLENNGTMTTRQVREGEYEIKSTKPENAGKLEGFAMKYPNVFKLSENERKVYFDSLEKEVILYIKKKLK